MDVETFCKTYQRKMWKSMISRKKFDLNIWDIIQQKNEKVYYMPYSGIYKFEIKTRFCLKCSREIELGFRKNEFIGKTCVCSADKKKYLTLTKLTSLFNIDEAKNILKIFSNYKTRKLPNKTIFWLNQGYSIEESEQKVKEVQTVRSNKSPAAQKGARGFSIRTKEYWLSKGFSEEQATEKISEIQIKNGLNWYVSRYGKTKGQERYDERIKKWIENYKTALERDPTINERKMVSFSNASNESLKVFIPVYNKYKDRLKIYLGIPDNHEYFLRNDKTIFFYDFTIPALKIIVEFNGSKFHPNTKILTEEQLKNWKTLFSKESAETVIAKDLIKRKIAEHHGYTIITVWDTDKIENSINLIENLIEEKLNEN